jgi:hypothetical protein
LSLFVTFTNFDAVAQVVEQRLPKGFSPKILLYFNVNHVGEYMNPCVVGANPIGVIKMEVSALECQAVLKTVAW